MTRKHPSRRSFLLAALITALALLPGHAAAPDTRADADTGALLAQVRDHHRDARDLTARFVQTALLPGVGLETITGGDVAFARGGKMRWRYEGDDPQTIVSDGETLWIYQERDRSVIHQPLARLSPSGRVALDLLSGLERVEEYFVLSGCGPRCVRLVPQAPDPDLAAVEVELASGSGAFRAVTTHDPLGNTTRVELSDVKFNTDVADAAFRFTPPEGVEVFGAPEKLP